MTLKNTVLFILASLFLTGCSSMGVMDRGHSTVETAVFMDGDILVQNDNTYGLTLIGFKDNFEIIYKPENMLSLGETGEEEPYRYLINGSYFEGSRVHAGWLSIFGNQLTPLKTDQQLGHMAILDTSFRSLDFPELALWDSSLTNPSAIEFQTGPLVIYANDIDTLSIKRSINGMSSHLRTLLAYTEEDGMLYFIITRKVCTLPELGEHLLTLSAFKDKTLHVMNLDGGSSTALYSRNHPGLNYNVNRPLPIMLGLK